MKANLLNVIARKSDPMLVIYNFKISADVKSVLEVLISADTGVNLAVGANNRRCYTC